MTSNQKLLEDFFRVFLKSEFKFAYRPLVTDATVVKLRTIPFYNIAIPPLSMLEAEPNGKGEYDWIAIPSEIDQSLAEAFERFLQVKFPSLFKDYLCYKCILNPYFNEASLPEISPDDPLGWLQWSALEARTKPSWHELCASA